MTKSYSDGSSFREARIKAGMTQAHLAGAARLSIRTIRRADAGENIGPEARQAISAVLGLDPVERPITAAHASERSLSEKELRLREFSYRLFAKVGGIHPALCVCFLVLVLYSQGLFALKILFPSIRADPLALVILFPASVIMAYILARRNNLSHDIALGFVQGQRFIDGTPTELSRRVKAAGWRGL